jgi:radical SAM superfamily enzyme YgiQ (UPF0313 family)
MRIALVLPGLGLRGVPRQRSLVCLRPTALAILAGLTPPDVEVRAFDDRFEAPPYDESWDLVALSVGTFQARRAYEIAHRFRQRGTKVVLGGFHPSQCPDEAARYADSVAVGEAEVLWPRIVEDCRRGRLQRIYRHEEPADLTLCHPDHRVLDNKGYAPVNVVQFARGCQHSCDFCSVRAFYPRGPRHRPLGDVVEELAAAPDRWTFFADDNLTARPDLAKTLLREIEPMGKRWVAQTSLDFVDDPELLRLMARSGCQCVIVGLESLNSQNIRQMGKGWARAEDYARKLAVVRDHGIMVYATFVFGYDGDTPDVFQRTYDFAMGQKFFLINFNHLNPFPGTRLYERLRQEGRLKYERWWIDPRYRFGEVSFHPRGMSADELSEGAFRIRAKIHGYPAMLRRVLDRKTNAASLANALTFLLVNVGSRQDVLSKQGLPLGLEPTMPEPILDEAMP